MVHGIQAALEPSRQLDETLATKPEFELDRMTSPIHRYGRYRIEIDRKIELRPKITDFDWKRQTIGESK